MVDFKYKVTDIAKDFGISTKKVIETFAELTGETRKTGATFEENEVNALMEALTRETAVKDLGEYLASGKEPQPVKQETKKPEAKPQAKKEEPKPEAAKPQPKQPKQPEAPKAEPKAEQAKPAQNVQPKAVQPKPAQQEKRNDKRNDNKQAEKRSEKRVTMQELASETGIKEPVATEQVKVDRAQVSVDTRTVDVNVDKFSARYDDLADSRNMPSKRKNAPTGKKEKFNNRNNRRGQQFGRRRETEAERLQRIQLEKARSAQLKVMIPDEITVGELASRMKKTGAVVVKNLMKMGVMASMSDVIDYDTAALVAMELGCKVEKEVVVTIEEKLIDTAEDREEDLVSRPPVIVVMGHVDHGKTSLLDKIRSSNVTAGEAGGITQAIGAYQVNVKDKTVTFLDTPGHEAFTAMRARGAMVTDIAILVVAADDGIMPQTVEAINHAKAAEIPIIVAVNKMDLPGANPENIKQQLTKYELVPEEWGGETIVCPISAKTGEGIDELLEMVLLTAEMRELKANPNRSAMGAVIEARLDKGRGPIATLLVQNGTLNQGDIIIAGTAVGRVRAMVDYRGKRLKTAGPSVPVEITGMGEVPGAGDDFYAVADERMARELAEQRKQEKKDALNAPMAKKVSLDDLFSQIQEGEVKDLNIIVKADVQGSVEAVKQNLEKISNEEVRVRVIHGGVGAINESDIMLASTSNAIVVGFNVRPDPVAKGLAERNKVDMRMYRVIYECMEEIEAAMKGMLAPKFKEVELGRVEVRKVYKISNVGIVAGCYVTEGRVTRNAQLRLVRDGIVIHEGEIASLQRFKDSVKEVVAGYECGITLEKFTDIKPDDIFECFEMQEIER